MEDAKRLLLTLEHGLRFLGLTSMLKLSVGWKPEPPQTAWSLQLSQKPCVLLPVLARLLYAQTPCIASMQSMPVIQKRNAPSGAGPRLLTDPLFIASGLPCRRIKSNACGFVATLAIQTMKPPTPFAQRKSKPITHEPNIHRRTSR